MTMGRWDDWVPGNGAGDKTQHPSPPWTGRGSRGGVMTPALTMDDGRWTMGAGEWRRRLVLAGRRGLEDGSAASRGGGEVVDEGWSSKVQRRRGVAKWETRYR